MSTITLDEERMKAIVCTAYGPPEVLVQRELPVPRPEDHQVRIRVHATTVSAACTIMRRAETVMARLVLGLRRPRARSRVMGTELAGEIDAVGRKVTRFRPGQRVFGFAGLSLGTYAEWCCLPEGAALEIIPNGLSFEDAAAMVDGPTTAMYFLEERAHLRAGDRVLIIGASGSVGSAAVQLAHLHGADVTGVCSGPNVELVKALGASRVLDYTREDYVASGQYEIVFDAAGKSSFARCRGLLTPDGRYLLTVGGVPQFALDVWHRLVGGRFMFGMSIHKHAALARVARLAAAGRFRPLVDRRYALEQIVEAHRYVDTGHKRGNVVITVPQGDGE